MKKILALILALLMTMTVFVGCGNTDADTATNDNATVDEATADELPPDITVIIEPFHDNDYNQYQMKITNDGVSKQYNGGEYSAEYTKDLTVEEFLTQLNHTDFELIDENNGKFLGWMPYRVEYVYDEEGLAVDSTCTKISDELYTSEEMLDFTLTEGTTAFVAKWDGVSDDMYKELGY